MRPRPSERSAVLCQLVVLLSFGRQFKEPNVSRVGQISLGASTVEARLLP